jgi:hypothetical protein
LFLMRQKLRDPASYKAEFLAQFRNDRESLFALENIEPLIESGIHERIVRPGVTYHAFVDPSGGSSDSMTLGIAHLEDDIAVLDVLKEVVPPFSPETVVREFCGYLRMYRCFQVTGDRFGAQWVVEAFEKNNISYRASDFTKAEIYSEALPITMSRQCRFLDYPKFVTQMCSLERRAGRSGKDSIDHPSGQHDDLANSAAGAIVLAMQSSGRVLGFVEYLKSVSAGTISDPAVPKLPASFNETLPKCGHCKSSCTVRGADRIHCNQCSCDSKLNGTPLIPMQATSSCNCGAPIVHIGGGGNRCTQCGLQTIANNSGRAPNSARRGNSLRREAPSYRQQKRGNIE